MRQHLRAFVLIAGLLAMAAPSAFAQGRYTATRTGDIVVLEDTQAKIRLSVVTTVNNPYELVVNGHDVIRKTFASVDAFRERPGLDGIPLLWPYANRLDEQAFYANGQKYSFDTGLGNTGRGAVPIHGYVMNAKEWQLVEAKADASGAWVTGRLDFYKHPRYMKQFPFAHTVTVTYRVADGMVEVRTRLDNMSAEPMPVTIGYHPYFHLSDSARSEWRVSLGAKTHWLLDNRKIPTGQTQPITSFLTDPKSIPADMSLDDVFTDFETDAQGRSVVTLKGRTQQLDVLLGPKYKTVLLYVPPTPTGGRGGGPGAAPPRDSVAIEPMAAVSNAMNMAHHGLYKDLQSVEPGGTWEESFWLRPSGF